jgi:hypothetical protein
MPVKTALVSEAHVRNVELPQHGKSYTVIPHGHAIDETKKALLSAGFMLKSEQYKTTLDGQVAQGIYHLEYGNDPDMGLMFAWSNSYNKSMKFKCAVGGHVFICMNGVVRGDMSSFVRKHTGSALYEATLNINDQISNAKQYFDTLVQDKELLKNVILSPREKGTILGLLFAEQEILTLTQVGIVKREMDKPSHHYNCDPNSAWAMYNHVTYALKESHPNTYLHDHEVLHHFFINQYGQLQTTTPVVTNHTDDIEYTEESMMPHTPNYEEQPEDFELEPAGAFGVTFL